MKFLTIVLPLMLFAIMPARAEAQRAAPATRPLECRKILPVSKQNSVLYKNENIHGGRGRTFLDQDHQFKGTPRLLVAGLNRKVFACFGLFACDQPYGCRYYQAMCGDRLSNAAFVKQARKNGTGERKPKALVGDGKGKCFSFNAATSREGAVH